MLGQLDTGLCGVPDVTGSSAWIGVRHGHRGVILQMAAHRLDRMIFSDIGNILRLPNRAQWSSPRET